VSEVFKERLVSNGCLDARYACFRLFLERSFDNRVEPFLRDHCRRLHLVSPHLRERPEIPEPRALRDDALGELKRLREAAERVVGRAALVPHLCAPRFRQRAGEGVQIVAEEELRGAVEREARVEVLGVARQIKGGDFGEDTEGLRRMLFEGLEVRNSLPSEKGARVCTMLLKWSMSKIFESMKDPYHFPCL